MENQKKRNTLDKSELLRLKRDFDALKNEGQAIFAKGIRLVFRRIPGDVSPNIPHRDLMVAFIIPKKFQRTAVSRNLIRRRLKETYRQNKHPFTQIICEQDFRLHLLFVVLSKKNYSFTSLKSIYFQLMYGMLQKLGITSGIAPDSPIFSEIEKK